MDKENIGYIYIYIYEKEMAPHSSTLAWKIPWAEERSKLQFMGRKESGMTEGLHFTSYIYIYKLLFKL